MRFALAENARHLNGTAAYGGGPVFQSSDDLFARSVMSALWQTMAASRFQCQVSDYLIPITTVRNSIA